MAGDFISITRNDSAATHAGELLTFIRALRTAYEQGKRLDAIMTHNHDASDFTAIETLFGLPEGSGESINGLVNGAVAATEGVAQNPNCKNITEMVG